MRRRLGFLAAVLVLAWSTDAAAAASPPVKAAAAELVRSGATSAVVYVSTGAHTYAAAAGTGSPRAAERFRIGSVTKTFVATIVLQLAQEQKLRLDDTLQRYVPAVHVDRRITLRELLDHTSGLANFTDYQAWLDRAEASRRLRPIDVLRFAAAKPRVFQPGTFFSYSNTNYIALGLVVEKVTGRTLREELDRRIVRPLGLAHTELAATRRPAGLRDTGTNPNLPWAAGGIVSTAADLTRFFRALMTGRLLSRASLDEMEQTVRDATGGRYGLGIEAITLPCGAAWGHTGLILDYATQVTATADGRSISVIAVRGRATRLPDLARLQCP